MFAFSEMANGYVSSRSTKHLIVFPVFPAGVFHFHGLALSPFCPCLSKGYVSALATRPVSSGLCDTAGLGRGKFTSMCYIQKNHFPNTLLTVVQTKFTLSRIL